MAKLPTVREVLAQLRVELDEPLDEGTNFWTDAELLEYLNRGLEYVAQAARSTGERRFYRKITSSDAPLVIHDILYDPSSLKLSSGTSELRLPPDFQELVSFEPVMSSVDTFDNGIVFHRADINSDDFRAARRATGPDDGGEYLYDVVFRVGGAYIVLAPTPRLSSAADVELEYVIAVPDYALDDTFEGGPFNAQQLRAARDYAKKRAYAKGEDAERKREAKEEWLEAKMLVIESSGPRISHEPEVVHGFMEEDI